MAVGLLCHGVCLFRGDSVAEVTADCDGRWTTVSWGLVKDDGVAERTADGDGR